MPITNKGSVKLGNTVSPSTTESINAKMPNTGTYYLANNPEIYEIQRTNNFVFYTSGLSKMIKVDANTTAEASADSILELSVSKSSVPHFKQSPIPVKRGNNTMKFAGVPEFESGSISVNDYIGSGVKDILMAWQARSYNVETEKVGLAKDYKVDAYLLEYTPDYQLVRTWKLVGCWISGISEGEYNHESNDKHSIDVTIEYDKAYMETNKGQ